jgi:hypothetical protein
MSDDLRQAVNARVREAIAGIRPLPGNGPNRWTVEIDHGAHSAPTKRELCQMLWHIFKEPECSEAVAA